MALSKTITEYEPFPGGRAFIAPTKAKDVVTIVGSVFGGEYMLPCSLEQTAGIAAELLDAGTKTKSQDILRNSLADRGASISFTAGGDRTQFFASCLPEDLPFILKLIAECLGESIFPASELKAVKERVHGDLFEEKTDTRTQAAGALSRLLYDSKHVNYVTPTSTQMKDVAGITRANLLTYRSLLGKGGLVLAITGDVSVLETKKAIDKAFTSLPKGTTKASDKRPNTKKSEKSEQRIPISDKANIDVYLGGVVPITTKSEHYIPFMVLSNMLGGRGFTNHLMQTLRERDSLTYGVYTLPSGFSEDTEGCLRVWAAFSPQMYEKSMEALHREIKFFFKKGITTKTLQTQQNRMVGVSVISLSTTKGLANALHSMGVQGKPLSYIDEYPELIKSVTLKDLHAVAELIPVKKFSVASAGTFVK